MAGVAPEPELTSEREDDVKLTTQQRLDRIEAAINGLAYFEGRLAPIKAGICVELDAIRAEQAGGIVPAGQERRPFAGLPESRERVSA